MKNILLYTGWVLAVLGFVTGFYLWTSDRPESRDELQTLRDRCEELTKENAALQNQLALFDSYGDDTGVSVTEKSQLMERIEQLEEEISLLSTATAHLGKDESTREEDETPEHPMAAMAKMLEGEQGRRFAEISSKMNVNMQYEQLFEELFLPADKEEQVRQLLIDYTTDTIVESARVWSENGFDQEDLQSVVQQMNEQLTHDLSAVLSSEQMAVYEEYQRMLPMRTYTQYLDQQMAASAPRLTPESRTIIRDTIADEFSRLTQNQTPLQDNTSIHAQIFDSARQRLSTTLDEEQYAYMDYFLRQQEEIMQGFTEHMIP